MKRSRLNPWVSIGFDAWGLGVESATVIGLRTLAVSREGPASAEARRMLSEKVDAAVSLQVLAMTGGLGITPASASARTLAHYRRKVSANRRRLSRL